MEYHVSCSSGHSIPFLLLIPRLQCGSKFVLHAFRRAYMEQRYMLSRLKLWWHVYNWHKILQKNLGNMSFIYEVVLLRILRNYHYENSESYMWGLKGIRSGDFLFPCVWTLEQIFVFIVWSGEWGIWLFPRMHDL